MNLQDWLAHIVVQYPVLVYGIIVLTSYIEGPILSLLCGIFYRLGIIEIIPAYFALMAGDLLGDTFWYWMGRLFGPRFVRRFGRYVNVDEKSIRVIERVFHRHQTWILIISKLTMGLGFALVTLFTAGMVRIPFKRYILLNFIGQFFWTAILLVVGYFFGHLFATFDSVFAKVSFAALLIVAIVVLFRYGSYVRARMTKRYSA